MEQDNANKLTRGLIVMAYVVMVYVVMAYVAMAYVVMAHIVTANIVMAGRHERAYPRSQLTGTVRVLGRRVCDHRS